jgi:hypothetical protein
MGMSRREGEINSRRGRSFSVREKCVHESTIRHAQIEDSVKVYSNPVVRGSVKFLERWNFLKKRSPVNPSLEVEAGDRPGQAKATTEDEWLTASTPDPGAQQIPFVRLLAQWAGRADNPHRQRSLFWENFSLSLASNSFDL